MKRRVTHQQRDDRKTSSLTHRIDARVQSRRGLSSAKTARTTPIRTAATNSTRTAHTDGQESTVASNAEYAIAAPDAEN
jgi:hypothetical protein